VNTIGPLIQDRSIRPATAVNEKERSQHRRVLVRLILQISQRALRGPPDRVMALIWIMPLVR